MIKAKVEVSEVCKYLLSVQLHFAVPSVSQHTPLLVHGIVTLHTLGKISQLSPLVPGLHLGLREKIVVKNIYCLIRNIYRGIHLGLREKLGSGNCC